MATVSKTEELKKRHGVCQERIVTSVLEARLPCERLSSQRELRHFFVNAHPQFLSVFFLVASATRDIQSIAFLAPKSNT